MENIKYYKGSPEEKKEACLCIICETANKLGKTPRRKDTPFSDIIFNTIGVDRWWKVLEEAGMPDDYKPISEKYDKEECKNLLWNTYRSLGRTPRPKDFKASIYNRMLRIYGGRWWKVLECVGIPDDKKPVIVKYNKEECVKTLKDAYIQLGRIPKTTDFPNNLAMCISNTLGDGHWHQALKKIGLNPKEEKMHYYAKVVRDWMETTGETPIAANFPFYTQIVRSIGWNNFLKKIGLKTYDFKHNKRINITNDQILNEILALRDNLGRWPYYREYSHCGLAVKRFGKWSNACRMAEETAMRQNQ